MKQTRDDKPAVTLACSRRRSPHVLGTVWAMPGGDHELAFMQSILDVEGPTAVQTTVRLSELEARMAYCSKCRKKYPIEAVSVRAALAARQEWVVLNAVGFIKDPHGVLRRRSGQR